MKCKALCEQFRLGERDGEAEVRCHLQSGPGLRCLYIDELSGFGIGVLLAHYMIHHPARYQIRQPLDPELQISQTVNQNTSFSFPKNFRSGTCCNNNWLTHLLVCNLTYTETRNTKHRIAGIQSIF